MLSEIVEPLPYSTSATKLGARMAEAKKILTHAVAVEAARDS